MCLKISVITCTKNSGKHLETCIESLLNQSFKNIEHIFIDSKSNDNTLDIIHKYYQSPKLLCEKDRGVYDAFNKGIKMASGNIIGFLHSDDYYADKNCLKRVKEAFTNHPNLGYFCARMIQTRGNKGQIHAILGGNPSFNKMLWLNCMAHPTIYLKRGLFKMVGGFNLKYPLSSDFDWMLSLLDNNLKYYYDPIPLICHRIGGVSSVHYFRGLREEFTIKRDRYGIKPIFIISLFWNIIRRIVRYIFGKLRLNWILNIVRCIEGKRKYPL